MLPSGVAPGRTRTQRLTQTHALTRRVESATAAWNRGRRLADRKFERKTLHVTRIQQQTLRDKGSEKQRSGNQWINNCNTSGDLTAESQRPIIMVVDYCRRKPLSQMYDIPILYAYSLGAGTSEPVDGCGAVSLSDLRIWFSNDRDMCIYT